LVSGTYCSHLSYIAKGDDLKDMMVEFDFDTTGSQIVVYEPDEL